MLISKQGESSSRDPYSIQASTSPSSASFSNTAGKMTANRSFGKAISKLKGPKTLAQVAKQEEECRSRLGQSSDAYRGQVVGAQSARHEYFNTLLPKVLRVSRPMLGKSLMFSLADSVISRASKRVPTSATWAPSIISRDMPTFLKVRLSTTA